MSLFQTLNKAPGATIIFEQTKKYYRLTQTLQERLQERLTLTRTLTTHNNKRTIWSDILFCEGLKQAAFMNWQLTLTKTQNHINKLSPRELSLMGKAIILNTLILAKTAYLSNIFPIRQNILTQIHKQIFHYIWPKNQEHIARKLLYLPKNKGGINIEEPEVHNLAIRIKHLLNLKYEKTNCPGVTWLPIG